MLTLTITIFNDNGSVVKDYKTTPKMGGRLINKGIENGVVSVRDYTKEYTTGYTRDS